MDHVVALRQISITAQCYSSILFRRQQENPSSRREGRSIQRHEETSAPACGKERALALAPLFICLSLPGPALCKLGHPGVLFVLPEVLTPMILGPSFVLFSQAFPLLVFQPPPFSTPFPYSTYLTHASHSICPTCSYLLLSFIMLSMLSTLLSLICPSTSPRTKMKFLKLINIITLKIMFHLFLGMYLLNP